MLYRFGGVTVLLPEMMNETGAAATLPTRRVKSLALKTRRYKESPNDDHDLQLQQQRDDPQDEDDEGHLTCTICLGPIQEGDRVGELASCNHVFHVTCLKSWLVRRNQCPLCAQHAATPQYEKHQEESDENNDAPAATAVSGDANTQDPEDNSGSNVDAPNNANHLPDANEAQQAPENNHDGDDAPDTSSSSNSHASAQRRVPVENNEG
eukprot:CAMPEP_0116824134 /NCGR_PEP_ID=MMETSP0418-20121206/1229_1 /TAXON_ID=1158023 /ORGANISM="Astrosyne radiata, Strain 13vi08-1A" /LENGTH=208 /DNA_ID=CAMNT_0004452473 /DNA_START=1 /DNA_END=627 /DNA_ORIENTATION=-